MPTASMSFRRAGMSVMVWEPMLKSFWVAKRISMGVPYTRFPRPTGLG